MEKQSNILTDFIKNLNFPFPDEIQLRQEFIYEDYLGVVCGIGGDFIALYLFYEGEKRLFRRDEIREKLTFYPNIDEISEELRKIGHYFLEKDSYKGWYYRGVIDTHVPGSSLRTSLLVIYKQIKDYELRTNKGS